MIIDPSDEVKEKCIYTIDQYSSNLKEEFEPYAKTTMINALTLLTKGKRMAQEMSIPIITSTANAIGEVNKILNNQKFVTYFEPVFKLMKQLMEQKEELILRARATGKTTY
jgi:hypothetical protein